MFELRRDESAAPVRARPGRAAVTWSVADVLALATSLADLDRAVDDGTRIDRIRALEVLKAAAAAAQARDANDLDASQRALHAAAGIPAAERGRGVAAQVALARRESPHRGDRHLGLAKALVQEMPHTLSALTEGRISEWRATILARETAVLTREHRGAVDRELAGTRTALVDLERLGDRALAARAKQVAYRLDPQSVVERARRAETSRCVTIRPAPDTMAYLTALLPVRDAIATHTALSRAAEAARNSGDPRSRGQLMADTLSRLVTSRAGAAGQPGPEDVAIRLVMTDRALLDGDDEPAHLDGYGPVPAAWARGLVSSTLDNQTDRSARVFIKRLVCSPVGDIAAMDSRARLAPTSLRAIVGTRDLGSCRTPWCDAPVRHIDHITPHAAGGGTRAHQLQGLCERCNQIKQALGWQSTGPPGPARRESRPEHRGRHAVTTRTPTGHTYRSVAPLLPGIRPPEREEPASVIEACLLDLVA
jgi:hypothetical protein